MELSLEYASPVWYLSTAVVMTLVFYAVGKSVCLILPYRAETDGERGFEFFIGLSIVIVLWALFMTMGSSGLLFTGLVGASCFYLARRLMKNGLTQVDHAISWNAELRFIGILFVLLLVHMIWCLSWSGYWDISSHIGTMGIDEPYYVTIASRLGSYEIENMRVLWAEYSSLDVLRGLSFYHFFDLWFISLIAYVAEPTPGLVTYWTIYSPLCYLAISVCCYAYLRRFVPGASGWVSLLVSASVPYIGGYIPISSIGNGGMMLGMASPKATILYALIFALLALFKTRFYVLLPIIVAGCIVLNPIVIALFPLACLPFVQLTTERPYVQFRKLQYPFIGAGLLVLWFILMTVFRPELSASMFDTSIDWVAWVTSYDFFYSIFRRYGVAIFYFSSLFVVFGVVVWKRKQIAVTRPLLLDLGFLMLAFFLGCFLSSLIRPASQESFQFYSYVGRPSLIFALVLSIAYLSSAWKTADGGLQAPVILATLLLTAQLAIGVSINWRSNDSWYSRDFLERIQPYASSFNGSGGSLINESDYQVSRRSNPYVLFHAQFIKVFSNDAWAMPLNPPSREALAENTIIAPAFKHRITESPFFRFWSQSDGLDLGEAQLHFVKEKGIQFIVMDNGVSLPDSLSEEFEVVIRDTESGQAVAFRTSP